MLGGSPAWPNPGQAASGYLLESEERRMLIDCGSGIAQELRAVNPPPLTDILITHFHADHWFDLVPLHYAFRYGSWRDRPKPLLHLPPGGRGVLDTVASVWDGSVETFEAAFDLIEYDPHDDLRLGDLHITFAPCLHYTTCYSVKIADAGSGDRLTRPTPRRPNGWRVSHTAPTCSCARRRWAMPQTTPASAGTWTRPRPGVRPAEPAPSGCCSPTSPRRSGTTSCGNGRASEYTGPIDLAMPGLRIDV